MANPDILAQMLKLAGAPLLMLCAATLVARGDTEPGARIYAQHCASCHDSGTVRIPTRSVLREQTSASIVRSLQSGVMKQQGEALSSAERVLVAQWLGRKTDHGITGSRLTNACKNPEARYANKQLASWTFWGEGLSNLRFQTAQAAGLTAASTRRLELKWAFAVPDATLLRSQPVVFGGRVIFGGEAAVYSLDSATGCTRWVTGIPSNIQSGISIGSPGESPLAFFGDVAGNVHAVDALTGAPVWQTHVDAHPAAMVSGTPVYYKERLYVPVSSFEESVAIKPGYVCCTFRGSILALDARTGKLLWRTFTIDDAAKDGRPTRGGAATKGPSGAGIWSSPTIDPNKGVLYVTTGDNYSDPPSGKSDAVIALSLETGKLLWYKQLRAGDAFNVGCMVANKKNCPDSNGPDFDFGAPAILASLPNGRRVLVLSQKSGVVFGVDPDEQGKLIWQSQVGKGGPLGGIEWGSASDGNRVYVALSDQVILPPVKAAGPPVVEPGKGGGLFALRLDNGERIWMTPPPPCKADRSCSPGQPGAVTGIPGVVFSGSLDGHIRGYSAVGGTILWDYDTVHAYTAVNGVPGVGGSLSAAGPVVAGGTLYTTSGYSQFGGLPGNMLLAFSADGH